MRPLFAALGALLVATLTLPVSVCLADSWQSIGPFGGSDWSLAIDPGDPQTLYVGSYGGVFKSRNGGALWSPASTGVTDSYANALAMDRNNTQTLYVGTQTGVFKTTNGAASWSAASLGLSNKRVAALALDPVNGQNLYAGTGGGVFKSIDGGATWSLASSGITTLDIASLAIDPVSRQTAYAGTFGGGLFKTSDGGATWSALGSAFATANVMGLAVDPNDSRTVYASTMGAGVQKSSDGGATWTGLPGTGGSNFGIAIDPNDSRTLYVAQAYGVLKSSDAGASWTTLSPSTGYLAGRSVAVDPRDGQSVYLGTYGYGLFKTVDGGSSWGAANNGITNIDVGQLAVAPTDGRTIYAGAWRGFYSSSDGGVTWSAGNTGMANTSALLVDPTDSRTVYAAKYGGPFKSSDGGATWSAINSGIPLMWVTALALDPSNRLRLYAGTDDGIYLSSNGGGSWTRSSTGLPAATTVRALALDPAKTGTIYSGTGTGVYKSSDMGATWSPASAGMPAGSISALVLDPANSQTLYALNNSSLYKSVDGAGLWTPAGVSGGALAVGNGGAAALYLGTTGGVQKSSDGGLTWSTLTGGDLAGIYPGCLAVDPVNSQTVYAGAWARGAFKLSATFAPTLSAPESVTWASGTQGRLALSATGAPRPGFSVSGTLPAGMSFDTTTGELSGIPAAGSEGEYSLLFTAQNGIPPNATRGVTLSVVPALPLSVSIATPEKGSRNSSVAAISGSATGTGLAKVELQVTDGVYFLQPDLSFGSAPAWLPAQGTGAWSLDTSSVRWVDGLGYTASARAWEGSTPSAPVHSSFKVLPASNQAYTQVSLKIGSKNLRSGDSTVFSGQIMRLPDDGSSMSGLALKLVITPPSTADDPTPAPQVIALATGSGGAFASPTLSFVTAGVYLVQLRFDGNASLAACSSAPQPLYVNIQSGYAVVVTGRDANQTLLGQHTASTDAVVATLKKRGFLDANIKYLKSDAGSSVTKDQIRQALTVWARDRIAAAPAPLYLVMVDHGLPEGFVLDGEILTPGDLKLYFDTLENDPALVGSSSLSYFKRFIVIGSCYSGAFVEQLSKPGRVIITSAAAEEKSLAGVNVFGTVSGALYGGDYFLDTLFDFLGRGDSFKDAFNHATAAVRVRDPRSVALGLHSGSFDSLAQHPLLDDNGNGVGSYLLNGNDDGFEVAPLALGQGVQVDSAGKPADIARSATGTPLPPSATSQKLWLVANNNSRVKRAWAEIRPPGSDASGSGSGQDIPSVQLLPLVYDGNRWVAEYSSFSAAGGYDIYYYTADNQTGEISPAVHTRIYKQVDGNAAPTPFDLAAPEPDAAPDPVFALSWQESYDADGLSYTLLVARDQDFQTVLYRQEGLTETTAFLAADALRDPASYGGTGYFCQNGDAFCWWKVQAVDRFGALTESLVARRFTVTTTNAPQAMLKGYVTSSVTGLPIANASVKVVSAEVHTQANGLYFMMIPTGKPYVTASAEGFTPVTVEMSSSPLNLLSKNFPLAPLPVQHQVGSSVTGSGSVSPAGTRKVDHGTAAGFTLTPAAGYRLEGRASGSCPAGSFSGNSYSTGAIHADCTVGFSFLPESYPISSSSTGSGSVSCLPASVGYNGSSVCTLVAAAGYRLSALTDNGVGVLGQVQGQSYTVRSVTAGHAVLATFTPLPVDGVCGPANGASFSAAPTSGLCSQGSPDAAPTGSGPWNWLCRGANGGADAPCRATVAAPASYPLTVQLAGNGSGAVNSSPGGIACASGSASGCSNVFSGGQSVRLFAFLSAGSSFGGWSGACSGTSDCDVTMDQARTVTATFTSAAPVRIGSVPYPNLQSAYDAAANGAVIMLREGELAGSLLANRPVGVTLRGGYNAGYSAVVGSCTLRGQILLRSGTVRSERMRFR